VTILECVPAVLQEMLSEDDDDEADARKGASCDRPLSDLALRFVLPTGEALLPELARRWLERHPAIPLINAYGPAECADDVALARIDAPPAADQTRMPIGRPTDNTQLYAFDAGLGPTPVGVTGQIAVAGVGVGHGYLGDPARTAEVFVPHPFGKAGERLYLTGDLGRYCSDGVLEYVGRADHQIKLRGQRIELGEIEARLLELPGVEEAATALRSDAPGQARLVGYVVLAPTTPASGAADPVARCAALRTRLATVVPDAMVPSLIIALDALPRSAHGKLDRAALPAPDGDGLRAPYVAPRTELESRIARIWSEALGVDRIGVDDHFFDLGGHSLLITRVAARIRHELGVELPLRTLFDRPTVAAIAEAADAAARARRTVDPAELRAMADLLDDLEQA
jgi:acyl-coenzyme A synthetase/AMP-(fatty) acid ligase/acyl carrier protein